MARLRSPRITTGIYIANEDLPKLIRALDHYAAYMRATKRDDRDYAELAAGAAIRAHRLLRSEHCLPLFETN